MQRELGREVDFQQIIAAAARSFADVFASEVEFVSNLDDLGRKLGVPMRPPGELQRLHKEEESYWA
jgi:hypothetical protein